jgi:iron only hydrogenase large subunit-like protein
MAIWLTNDGVRSIDSSLTFAEIADILRDLAMWSDAAQDPLTTEQGLREQYPDDPSDDTEAGSSQQAATEAEC